METNLNTLVPNTGELYVKNTRLVFSDGVFVFILALLATIFPQLYGLIIARDGLRINNVLVGPVDLLAKLNFDQYFFYLLGFIPGFLTVLFFIFAVCYPKISSLKFICIFWFAILNFFVSIGYLRFGFETVTYAIYHSESHKINAINIGIITAIIIAIILLILIIFILILRHFISKVNILHTRKVYIITFLILANVAQWIVFMSLILTKQ